MASYDVASNISQALSEGGGGGVEDAVREEPAQPGQGIAVQVDPIKPKLKLPGAQRLKL